MARLIDMAHLCTIRSRPLASAVVRIAWLTSCNCSSAFVVVHVGRVCKQGVVGSSPIVSTSVVTITTFEAGQAGVLTSDRSPEETALVRTPLARGKTTQTARPPSDAGRAVMVRVMRDRDSSDYGESEPVPVPVVGTVRVETLERLKETVDLRLSGCVVRRWRSRAQPRRPAPRSRPPPGRR